MKHRGNLIINEFAMLRRLAGNSRLELPPEYAEGRQLFRKRNQLFKKLKLDPNNEHHVAFLCSIVYDHLYLSKPSAAETKFGDNRDFDLVIRFLRYAETSQLKRYSDVCRNFIKKDKGVRTEYGNDASVDRFRVRLNRAAKKAIDGRMELTAKRKVLLQENLPEIREYFGESRKRRT